MSAIGPISYQKLGMKGHRLWSPKPLVVNSWLTPPALMLPRSEQHKDRIGVFYLPAYRPELSLDEILDQDTKSNAV
jgi:hypothetical protein